MDGDSVKKQMELDKLAKNLGSSTIGLPPHLCPQLKTLSHSQVKSDKSIQFEKWIERARKMSPQNTYVCLQVSTNHWIIYKKINSLGIAI